MNTEQDLRDGLQSIITRVEDIDSLFEEHQNSSLLTGIKEQAEFMLDIAKEVDLLIYGYHRYIYEINGFRTHHSKGESVSTDRHLIMGRHLVVDFAHLVCSFEDVFKRFPGDDEIAEKSALLLEEDRSIRQEAKR